MSEPLRAWTSREERAPVARPFRAPALSDAVIYELHVGTFTKEGTFEAVIDHLDHLVELGITHVDLHAESADGLRELVDAFHARKIAAIVGVTRREVRRVLIDSGADGLRVDAPDDQVGVLVDEIHWLERELRRPLVVIGAYDEHDPKAITPTSEDGWGLNAHTNADFHRAVHALLTREDHDQYADFAVPCALAKVLEHGYALDGCFSTFRNAHHGKPFGERPRDRLIAFVESHAQIASRPGGERLHQIAGLARAKIAAALLLTSPFVPMIYQGEEWAASTSSSLHWEERHDGDHAHMFAWYSELVSARHTYEALRDARPFATRVREIDGGRGMFVRRGDLGLYCNFSAAPLAIEAEQVLLASDSLATHRELPPLSCALVRRWPRAT